MTRGPGPWGTNDSPMALSSSLLPLFSLPPPSPRRRAKSHQTWAFPTPKPQTKRPNRLRTKLPGTQIATPQCTFPLTETDHQLLFPYQIDEAANTHISISQTVEEVGELEREEEGFNPFAPAVYKPTFGIVLRFAALLLVQTLVAVWFLGRSLEETRDGQGGEELRLEKGVAKRALGSGLEHGKLVEEIKAMAREVREREKRELATGNYEVSSRSSPLMLFSRRSSVKATTLKKNAGLLISTEKRRNDGLDSLKEVASQKPLEIPAGVHKAGEREVHDSQAMGDCGDSNGFTDSLSQRNIRALRNNLDSTAGIEGRADFHLELERKSSSRESSPSSAVYDTESNMSCDGLASSLNIDTIPGNQSNEMSVQVNKEYPNLKAYMNDESKSSLEQNETEDVANVIKGDNVATGEKPWWLGLPYVLGIFLHRDVDHNGASASGLYTLSMNPSLEDGVPVSYTITFEDRSDASNFCYLLESYFEDLGDVNADIVPLTMQEVHGAVESNELRIFVARKGLLRMYAGQPLAEVETALRSLLRQI